MRNLFLLTTRRGSDFYMVAEDYAQAIEMFRGFIEQDDFHARDYYKIEAITHITKELYFFGADNSPALDVAENKLILPDTKPKGAE